MTRFLTPILCLLLTSTLFGQSWNIVKEETITRSGDRVILPSKYIVAAVDDAEIKGTLWTAPEESANTRSSIKNYTVDLMLADGSIDQFGIVSYDMMEPELKKRYPHIKTFYGVSTSNEHRTVRMDYTDQGMRAVISDHGKQTYIDHYQRNDKSHRIIYYKEDYRVNKGWSCDVHSNDKKKLRGDDHDHSTHRFSGDCTFRSFRLAVTATGEYSNYHNAYDASESSLVLSAITTTVNRMNQVMEQDITTRFILIGNVDDIFYYDPATDPFTGNNAGAMINQNQTNTTAVIGSANYDLGHIFSTGGSGLAGLGVICSNNNKARGVTGISVPEGDPFDIDYVSHEVGHQLGANHTQNNDCNDVGATNMEPGSASTIMGYAGICAPNVQNNSDAYFHAISIEEMNDELLSNNCHQVISLSNVAPVVSPVENKAIPHSTPFVLDVVATDADGDILTYNWEQMDNETGPVMPPAGTNSVGPMFRSKFATVDSKRYFPPLDNVLNGTANTWEVLPTVAREMDFRVTVRDNTFLPGCTDETDVTITVDDNGPFEITSVGTTPWLEAQTINIEWDVANTNQAPVSCANVDILLSYDGGQTFSVVLADDVSNDGSHNITVPQGTTTTARVMVVCSDNYFYSINSANIPIDPGGSTFLLDVDPSTLDVCDDQSAQYDIVTQSLSGYNIPITLSVNNLPPGTSISFGNNPVQPGSSTTMTISTLSGQSGIKNITLVGNSGQIERLDDFVMTVLSTGVAPALTAPANGSTSDGTSAFLIWESTGSGTYEYQVGTSIGVGNIAQGSTADNSVSIDVSGTTETLYWRVRSLNQCGTSVWSETWSFDQPICLSFTSDDIPINISSSGTPTITSTLDIMSDGIITDVNVVDLNGLHTWVSDLNFTLISPQGTELDFWSDPCTNNDNFDISFDDEATSSYPCPPTDGLTYTPDNPLSVFDTESVTGTWTLEVFDDFNQDGGSLQGWGLEVCLSDVCGIEVYSTTYDGGIGTLAKALSCAVDGDVILLKTDIAGQTIDIGDIQIALDFDVTIMADRADNITILGSSPDPMFSIENGATISLIGFDIESTSTPGGAIENYGELILEDMNITHQNSAVTNESTGNLTVRGICNLKD